MRITSESRRGAYFAESIAITYSKISGSEKSQDGEMEGILSVIRRNLWKERKAYE